ncbi:MAG: hypothetical protein LRY73_18860 [Bacillus sp. (in: Bacteria)]|nr:hypothetical protein [Bacillus sp. (in: firmicutes)]
MVENENAKLENYLVYGMIFGLLGGSVLSIFGTMFEIVFIQVGGVGIGLSLGMMIGVIIYSLKQKNK